MRRPVRPLRSLVVAMVVLIAAPLALSAAHRFDDVPDSNVFHDDIAWLADAGVTRGCNPPSNDQFCPSNSVTREQMAAFMHRLAEGQVVDAATAQIAENAELLDGKDSTAYTTKVWAANCGLSFDGATPQTSCLPETGNVVDEFEAVLTLEIDAPAEGLMELTSGTRSQGPMLFNFTVDEACPSQTNALLGELNGQPWGSSFEARGEVGHTTTAIPAGTHTVRVCAMNADSTGPTPVLAASLTAVWTPGGSISLAGQGTSPVADTALGLSH